jgi:hypothetical protein
MVKPYRVEAYQPWRMGSFGDASNMLLRQFNFPGEYDSDVDVMTQADHDRCFSWDYKHTREVFTKYLKTGELHLTSWLQEKETTDEIVMSFLKEMLNTEKNHPGVEWTGYQITYTVNRSNGYPVFSFSLFCNKSGVPVYSDDANVVITIDNTRGLTWGL